jgi:hypothetical protein
MAHKYMTVHFIGIKSGGIKLVLWSQTSHFSEMMRSYEYD